MSIVIDAVIISICVFIILGSWRRGLIKSVMGLVKGVVSLLAAYAFTPALSEIFFDKFAVNWISSGIESDIIGNTASGGTFDLQKLLSDIPEWFGQIIERYGSDKNSLVSAFGDVSSGSADDVSALSRFIASPVAGTLASVAAFAVIFVGIFILLSFVTFLLDTVFHLPLLHGANKLTGLIFGIFEAFLVASLISFLISSLSVSLGAVDGSVFGEHIVENSIVLKFLSKYNVTKVIRNVIG